MKKELIWLLALTISVQNAISQDTLSLNLTTALQAALKDNNDIVLSKLDKESAIAKYRQTNAVFLPQINVSYTTVVTNNPLNVFGFKLQQQSVSPSDFNPQLLNNPSTSQNYMAKAEWNQPLLNLDMISQRHAAEQQIDAYYFKEEWTKEYLTFEVNKAYALLQLSHQAVSVLGDALHTANSVLETSKNYFEKGYLQKSDLLSVQVQVASIENKLAEAKSNVRNASDYVSLLMGVGGGRIYTVDPLEKILDGKNLETQVSEDRADFKALKSALKAQDIMINSERLFRFPRLNAFANYVFNDKTAFGFGSTSYLVGAQLSWNLFNGTASLYRTSEQKITRSKIQQELSFKKQQSQLELNKALRQLQDARFELHKHETSVNQASEALRIRQSRFQQGLVSTSDLLQSQSTLSEQKLLLSETIFKYNTTLVYLQFLTTTTEK